METSNKTRVFHVETTWKQPSSRRFNIEYMWFVCKEVNNYLQERFTAENFAIISHTNINSKLDLFPDKFHANKLGVLLTSTMFDVFQN